MEKDRLGFHRGYVSECSAVSFSSDRFFLRKSEPVGTVFLSLGIYFRGDYFYHKIHGCVCVCIYIIKLKGEEGHLWVHLD